jgi:hypothetical protein
MIIRARGGALSFNIRSFEEGDAAGALQPRAGSPVHIPEFPALTHYRVFFKLAFHRFISVIFTCLLH